MEIEARLRAHADPARAAAMKAYMRGQFEYLGIPSPERRRLSRPLLRPLASAALRQAIVSLWALPEREFQYFGLELAEKSRKLWTPDLLELWHWMIVHKSWWDTVDFLASHLVGEHVRRFGGDLHGWIDSECMWVQRTALLYQLRYGQATDVPRLFGFIDRVIDSREFFLRKAIGWALRQLARTHPGEVRAFVAARHDRLSGLSRREALKHLQKTPAE